MSGRLSVAIAGAGVGGLVAASALRKAGADPVVLERATDLRHVQLGGSIHLWPNGHRGLISAGLYDAVRASVDDGAIMKRQLFESARGKILVDWSLDESELGLPTLAVVRGELCAVLADAAGDMLRLGAAVEGFEADDTGVAVRLANGAEERYDVLIGADGLRSRVRAGVVGESEPVYTDYTTWLSVLPMTHPSLKNTIRVFFGRGGRFIAWPVTGERIYWEAIYRAPAGVGDGAAGRKADVLELFGDWVEPIRAAIDATPEENITRADSYTRPFPERWGFGRVTLLGDAAHAMTNAVGQGANQAIEDAAVLGRCIERNTDPVAALREYESLRHARTKTFVKRSRLVARSALVRSPLGAKLRDVALSVGLRAVERLAKKDLTYDVTTL